MRKPPVVCTGLLLVGLAVAADPPNPASDFSNVRKNAAVDQERLRQQFGAFQQSLLSLAQRLEKSNKPEDREKAVILRQAIELAGREGVDTQFTRLIATLTASGVTLREIETAIGQNDQLLKSLREMIQLLLSDNNSAKLKEEQKRLQELVKKLDQIIRAQKIERSKVESGHGQPEELAKSQGKVTKDTKDLAKAMDQAGKPNDGKSADGKPTEAKDAGSPKDGQPGEPKPGQPKPGQPKDGNGQPNSGEQSPPNPNESEQARQQVQDAADNQRRAEDRIKKDDRQGASGQQDEAIKKLEEARKELERRLKQMREEELQRLLANLDTRCARMLALQVEVRDGTKRVQAAAQAQPDGKSTRAEDLKAGELSVKEGAIVVEANKAIQLLQEEGSAVAFPIILEDVRDQMKVVQARLFRTDVGSFTLSIEDDIISTLKDMLAALKKAQQDLKDKQNQPPPPPGGQPPPQKLIDMLADLKMIRSLQEQINKRTKAYAAEYSGEQTADPAIQKELHGLAGRQEKVHKVTKDLATGKNVGQ